MSNEPAFYLDSTAELKEFCNNLKEGTWIGIDTEFIRERTYYPQPCLLQLSSSCGVACVDVLAVDDLALLKDVLFQPGIPKLMHACGQDLEIFQLLFKGIPPNIFDTQVAAAFTGRGDQVSYAALVEDICRHKLHKAHTRARWCNRPLSDEEIEYAEDDVRYLLPLYETLAADLDRLGRRQWFDVEMQALADTDVFPINEQNAWKRIGSLKKMAGRQLACAKALAGWREKVAQKRDKPRNWIMTDQVLSKIADVLPSTRADLAAIGDMPDGLIKHRGEEILVIVRQSRDHQESDIPMSTGRPDAREKALKKALANILDHAAEEMNMPPSVIATRRDLTALIHGERDLPVLKGWRNDAVGEDLLEHLKKETE